MSDPTFQPGDFVRVRADYPPGHVRTPFFVRGCEGTIEHAVGDFRNPEELAYGRDGLPKQTLYRVRFKQTEIWNPYDGNPSDTLVVDIYEHWLERKA